VPRSSDLALDRHSVIVFPLPVNNAGQSLGVEIHAIVAANKTKMER